MGSKPNFALIDLNPCTNAINPFLLLVFNVSKTFCPITFVLYKSYNTNPIKSTLTTEPEKF